MLRHSFSSAVLVVLASTGLACSESHGVEGDAGPIVFDLDGAVFLDAAAPPSGNIGAACTSASDCTGVADTCLDGVPELFTDGYCSRACTVGGTDCPEGSACVDLGGQAFCLEACDPESTTRPCERSGYGCSTNYLYLSDSVCVAGCFDSSDCASGSECSSGGGNFGSGQCYDPSASQGGACVSDADCPSGGTCVTETDSGWPGGLCGQAACDLAANSGCPGDAQCIATRTNDGYCIDGCTTAADCRPGYVCRTQAVYPDRFYCAPGCTSDADCTVEGNVCNPATGLCDVPFDASQLGDQCYAFSGEGCVGGTCLSIGETGFPGAYCAYAGCTLGDDSTCPSGGVCAPRGSGRTYCLDACTDTSECRSGYACAPSDPATPESPTACMPACTASSQCGRTGYVCNVGTGLCAVPFDDSLLGTACLATSECTGGTCLTEIATGWSGGMCVLGGCRLSGEGASTECPAGSTCIDDAIGAPDLGVCAPGCADDSACRDGYVCNDGACRPACTETSCGAGRVCAASGLCET